MHKLRVGRLPLVLIVVTLSMIAVALTSPFGPPGAGAAYGGTVIATVEVGDNPYGVAVNPATNRIYVANYESDDVSVIDGSSNTVIATVPVGNSPVGVAANPNTNLIYVTNSGSNTVSVIDGANNIVVATVVAWGSSPWGIDVNPITNRVYVGFAGGFHVSVIDGATNEFMTQIGVEDNPYDVAVNPVTNCIYVVNSNVPGTVQVIDGNSNSVIATIYLMDSSSYPEALAVNPITNRIYVANTFTGTVSVINGVTNSVIATTYVGGDPRDIAVNSHADRIYVSRSTALYRVSVIDGADNTVEAIVTVGANPYGIAVNPETSRTYVANYGDGTVSVIEEPDADSDGWPDDIDNCPIDPNPDQENSDRHRDNGPRIPGDWASNPASDHLGDACDADDDNDGLADIDEYVNACPYVATYDSDSDRAVDGYEIATEYDLCDPDSKPTCEGVPFTDDDGDRLSNCLEHLGYNTCAFTADTTPGWSGCSAPQDSDDDGCPDILEILDLNGDRHVDSGDVGLLNRRSAGKIPADPVSDGIFDLNKDGYIDSGDTGMMNRNNCLTRPNQPGCPVCPAE